MTNFSTNAVAALEFARLIASELGHTYIGSEHLLLALLSDNDTDTGASRIFSHFRVTYADILSRTVSLFGKGERTRLSSANITPRLKRILEKSAEIADEYNTELSGEVLAIALLSQRDSVAVKLIEQTGASRARIMGLFVSSIENEEVIKKEKPSAKSRREKILQMKKETPVLNKYGRDLTEEATLGKIGEVIGREKETDRVIRVLMRRGKNNPCLIGEAGVGKTAIAEGLARRIAEGNVPSPLSDFRIVSLDISSVVAGAKYRGDFEERIRAISEEIMKCENVILMIDEIHNIVGAGSAEGAIDAANILKPALARDTMRIIGATTLQEYRKYIEKDSALERRFQPIEVREPTVEETLEILRGIRTNYEDFHSVKIDNSALEASVSLSVRFMPARFLPDKAIDLLDEACARCRIEGRTQVVGEDIAEGIRESVGIPTGKIKAGEESGLEGLEKRLGARVIGQDKAVEALVSAYVRSRLGLSDPERPRGSFLFAGPTGVGKSLLARAFAQEVYFRDSFIKLDMSEYSEPYSVSRLLGAPAGYVGYEDAGALEKVRRHPYSVVVFDEIEKAHRDVVNLLLQILDEGKISDSQGRVIDFKNTVIILTSNIGFSNESSNIGFSGKSSDENLRERVMTLGRERLSPELMSRLDAVVLFSPLKEEELLKIARLAAESFKERCRQEGVVFECTDDVLLKLVRSSDKKSGARAVVGAVRQELEEKTAEYLVKNGREHKNLCAVLDENGKVCIVLKEKMSV